MTTIKQLSRVIVGVVAIALGVEASNKAQAASFSIPINTGIVEKPGLISGDPDPLFTWNYTGNFTDPRYQTYTNGGATWIMAGGNIFSNNNYGADVPVGMPSFPGVAFLYHAFELPAEATNIKLSFSDILADDRVAVSLNSTELGAFSPWSITPQPGIMTDIDLTSVPRTFMPHLGSYLFDNQSLFKVGEKNVLRFWVNNTGKSTTLNTPAVPLKPGDVAALSIRGTLSYDIADAPKSVPEPSSILGLLTFSVFGVRSLLKHKGQQKVLNSTVSD